jgi:hypothetical protein
MQVRFRPLSRWPGERMVATSRRSRWTFKAGWASTLSLLERELAWLGARDVVIEVDLREDQIRIDGWPRSGASPGDPGVVVSFDSRYGPLRYATDVFDHYEANVRAIALGLEALRKVDRYGITRKGEQYTGWRALPAGIPLGPGNGFVDADDAVRWMNERYLEFYPGAHAMDMLGEEKAWAVDRYRELAKKLHPDTGGSTEEFQRLQAAWSLVRGVA